MHLRLCLLSLGVSPSLAVRSSVDNLQNIATLADANSESSKAPSLEGTAAPPTVFPWMTPLNYVGRCTSGHVPEEDQDVTVEECKEACLKNRKCHAVSYGGGTCSTYILPCVDANLTTDEAAGVSYMSFKKRTSKVVNFEDEYDVKTESEKSFGSVKAYLQNAAVKAAATGKPSKRKRSKKKKQSVAVISMLGSFAPLTQGHLNAFTESRTALLARGFDVVLGVMAFNPEGHVAAKLKRKDQPNIPFNIRHELAECAYDDLELPWMATEWLQGEFFKSLTRDPELEHFAFQVFFANGADDVYLGRKYEQCGKTFPDNRKFIMVGRPGDTDKVKAQLKTLGVSGKKLDCLWVDNDNSFSSSQLRKASLEEDADKVRIIAPPCVAAFMNGPYLNQKLAEEEEE